MRVSAVPSLSPDPSAKQIPAIPVMAVNRKKNAMHFFIKTPDK
jgi:hypothetical protein